MRRTKPKAKRSAPRERRKMVPISEEMRHWSALLETELSAWPAIIARPMFGFRAYFRDKFMFAAIPRTRSFGHGNSLIVKFKPMPASLLDAAEEDTRLDTSRLSGNGWLTFDIKSEADLHDAIWWIQQAHDAAKGAKRK
jgi:hypothetical protein